MEGLSEEQIGKIRVGKKEGIRVGTNGRDQSRNKWKGSEQEQMKDIRVGTNGRDQSRNKWKGSQ